MSLIKPISDLRNKANEISDLAHKVDESIFIRLVQNPRLGRIPYEEGLLRLGYRHLVVENYLIFYTIEGDTIYVHRILHGARDYLSLF